MEIVIQIVVGFIYFAIKYGQYLEKTSIFYDEEEGKEVYK